MPWRIATSAGARGLFAELAVCEPETAERGRIRDELVEMHLPLVEYLARRFRNRGEPLDDLVQAGYLKEIPSDPMTHSTTTWVTATSDVLESVDQSDPGINDVHSGSEEMGSNGQPYSGW